jgi:hypothetical protein
MVGRKPLSNSHPIIVLRGTFVQDGCTAIFCDKQTLFCRKKKHFEKNKKQNDKNISISNLKKVIFEAFRFSQ